MTTRRMVLAGMAATALVSGCSLIPDYQRPQSPVSPQYPAGPAYAAEKTAAGPMAADIGWQDFFRRPELRDLIGKALDNNRDLRVAAQNIEKTRAAYRIQRADLFPALNGTASDTRSRTPASLSSSGAPLVGNDFNMGLSVPAWELDFFGHLRSLEEQAREQYLASGDAARSVRIALVADVAIDYLTLLADTQLLALTEDTLKAQEDSYDLTRKRYDQGVVTALDMAQARTSVETARANRAQYTRQLAQDRNALELLVGAPLGDFRSEAKLSPDDFLAELPAGLPSDLLTRRPDIVEAEHSLKAASANIGAARAAYFPTISLTAAGGLASGSLSNLFEARSNAWNFTPQLSVPIFDWGRRDANYDSAVADRAIAVAQYEKAIQTSFREVADALAARGTYGDQLRAQKALVSADQDYYDLSRLRYQHGTDSYLTVLDAQRTLYAAQQTEIGVELARLSNLVTLYKVLGGGIADQTRPQSATPEQDAPARPGSAEGRP